MEDMKDTKQRRAWFPYVVSALGDNAMWLKNADSIIHIVLWLLMLLFEYFDYTSVGNHVQYLKDAHTEMESKMSMQALETLGLDMDGGTSMTDLTKLSPSSQVKFLKYASNLIEGHQIKTDLHGWAMEQTAEASFVTAIIPFLIIIATIMLHFSSGGVVPGGLPSTLISVVPAGLSASVLFNVLTRLSICADWMLEYTMRHAAQSDMLFSFLESTVDPPNEVLQFKTAAELNKDRDIYWIFAILIKYYLISIFTTNVRTVNRQSHSTI